ncbi:hypothetical protein Tco_1009987 [Tanacetum coccineum]
MKETPYELLKDNEKKQLGKNEEAKMTIYNALPLKQYERVFMCKTAKEVWYTLIITHQGNSQVKNCKIDLLTQEYEKFSIFNEETIYSGFRRFNAIVTSLKSLDPDYSSKNHVRNFILYEMVLDNDGIASKTTKEKVKSLALKAKVTREQTSDDSDSQDGSDEDIDEEEAEAFNLLARNSASFFTRTEDLDAYDSDCDDVSNAKVVLMANLSNYGSDVISEVSHFKPYHTDMDNQSVHTMQGFEQTPIADFTDNEITSDGNIISYSQYLQETQQAAVQDTNLYAQQDSMILSMIEQMSKQMINHVNNWEKANQEKNNESLTAELERYKERVKTFEQRLNIDLSTREKMIDSQMDDMIKEKLALK